MSDDELYKKLSAELDIIREEVVNLREKQHMFWELQKIIGANQDINVSNEFYDWIEEIYTTSMSVAIRRQVDGSKDSISFRRFLEEVGRHPCVVTRKRYSTFFSSSSAESIKSDFDGLVGAGRDYMDPSEVECDLNTLKGKAGSVQTYANSWVAHRTKGATAGPTTLGDIDAAVEGLERLLKKYLHLFRSEIVTDSLLPVVIGNWKAIFRVPWIRAAPH
jgi:hypothetical protein